MKAVLSFGRLNPPTIGHGKLVDKVKSEAKKIGGKPFVYLSHTQDAKKNPLDYNTKVKIARKAFGPSVIKSKARTVIEVLKELESKGITEVVFVAGSDRVKEFSGFLGKFNGKEYNFESLEIVSAGARDPDAEGVAGMSASKMRAAAQAGDQKSFEGGLPKALSKKDKVDTYNRIRKAMGVNEEFEKFVEEDDVDITDAELDAFVDMVDLDELDENLELEEEYGPTLEAMEMLDERKPLTVQQRLKIGRRFKRLAPKLKRARKIRAKRMADPARLKKRARKAAITLLRKKFGGKAGANFASLSPSAKINIDRIIQKKLPMVGKIAARLLPKIRKKETARLKSARSAPKESLDLAFEQALTETVQKPERLSMRAFANLQKKSDKSGVPMEAVLEVFDREEDINAAFERVNSFINEGAAREIDADVRLEKILSPDEFRGKGKEQWEITWSGSSGRAAMGQKRTTTMVGIPVGSKEADVKKIFQKKHRNKKFISAKKKGIVETVDEAIQYHDSLKKWKDHVKKTHPNAKITKDNYEGHTATVGDKVAGKYFKGGTSGDGIQTLRKNAARSGPSTRKYLGVPSKRRKLGQHISGFVVEGSTTAPVRDLKVGQKVKVRNIKSKRNKTVTIRRKLGPDKWEADGGKIIHSQDVEESRTKKGTFVGKPGKEDGKWWFLIQKLNDKNPTSNGPFATKAAANAARQKVLKQMKINETFDEMIHDKCGTPECCGGCDTAVVEKKIYRTPGPGLQGMKQIKDLPKDAKKVRGRKGLYLDQDWYYHVVESKEDINEAFTAGIDDTMYATEFEENQIQTGFAHHPDVIKRMEEEGGAGEEATTKLKKKYKQDTPGQVNEAPEFSVLKKNKVPLSPEERKKVIAAGAVWHMGPNGAPSPAVWKTSDGSGKTWYVVNTHRAFQAAPTLEGALKKWPFIKSTA